MNDETKVVLQDTYNMLMNQVEQDAPRVLEELQSKMFNETSSSENQIPKNLSEELQDFYINPFNIPTEFLLQAKSSK